MNTYSVPSHLARLISLPSTAYKCPCKVPATSISPCDNELDLTLSPDSRSEVSRRSSSLTSCPLTCGASMKAVTVPNQPHSPSSILENRRTNRTLFFSPLMEQELLDRMVTCTHNKSP
eukprot:764819-Hanusia_phi.AAC.5